MSEKSVCINCEYVGFPKRVTKGSLAIEIILWIAFIVPGMIYSAWRLTNRYDACPKCKAPSMVPADSPKGRKLLQSA